MLITSIWQYWCLLYAIVHYNRNPVMYTNHRIPSQHTLCLSVHWRVHNLLLVSLSLPLQFPYQSNLHYELPIPQRPSHSFAMLQHRIQKVSQHFMWQMQISNSTSFRLFKYTTLHNVRFVAKHIQLTRSFCGCFARERTTLGLLYWDVNGLSCSTPL